MTGNFQLLSATHLAILAAVPSLAGTAALTHRRLHPTSKTVRLTLAVALVIDTILYYGYLATHGQLTFPDHLPLELCDLSLVLILIALVTLNKLVFDVAYYTALAGATMALLTPNLWEPFPSFGTIQFFIAHGLIVAGALYLVWSGQLRPRPGSVFRAMIGVNLFAALVGTFDYFYKTDYMYLRAKPQNASLLSVLGPWPWYLLVTEIVAFTLFCLLYLPFYRHAPKESTKVAD
jgi:hypothetical integral membrane protein (TIGR02206 family)